MERDYQADYEHLAEQTRRLAEVLMHEFPEGFKDTDGSEGCIDMAIRLLRRYKSRQWHDNAIRFGEEM